MANTDDDNLPELTDADKRRESPDRGPQRGEGDVGQLVDPTPGVDDEPDAIAVEARDEHDPLLRDIAVQDLEEVQPAEEAAMHITEAPPMGDGDGYVD